MKQLMILSTILKTKYVYNFQLIWFALCYVMACGHCLHGFRMAFADVTNRTSKTGTLAKLMSTLVKSLLQQSDGGTAQLLWWQMMKEYSPAYFATLVYWGNCRNVIKLVCNIRLFFWPDNFNLSTRRYLFTYFNVFSNCPCSNFMKSDDFFNCLISFDLLLFAFVKVLIFYICSSLKWPASMKQIRSWSDLFVSHSCLFKVARPVTDEIIWRRRLSP